MADGAITLNMDDDDEINALFGGGDGDEGDTFDALFDDAPGEELPEMPVEANELSFSTQEQDMSLPLNGTQAGYAQQTDGVPIPEPTDGDNTLREALGFQQPEEANTGGNDELANLAMEGQVEGGEAFDLNNLNDMALDFGGEKADDAQDFDDISLSDEDEVPRGGPVQAPSDSGFLAGIEDSAIDNDDDLFGDGDDDLPIPNAPATNGQHQPAPPSPKDSDLASEHGGGGLLGDLMEEGNEMTQEELQQWRMQRLLLERRAEDEEPAATLDDKKAWLAVNFPKFSLEDESPFWGRLLPPKPGKWQAKEPKRPKPIRPTKISLELEQDQRAIFLAPFGIAPIVEKRPDYVRIEKERSLEEIEELTDDEESDEELPMGLTMQDLEMICTDFDSLSQVADDEYDTQARVVDEDNAEFNLLEDDGFNDYEHPIKKRRTGPSPHDIVTIHQFDLPSLDNPEKMTAKIARQVVLDLNDPNLLVEEIDQEALRQRARSGDKSNTELTAKDRMKNRFKTSNDAAYDLLKQNHQQKVRGQLSNMSIDHSIPAIKLQYPYFQVKLGLNDLRNWHRKKIQFRAGVTFSKLSKQKRKELKSRTVQEIYHDTKSLSFSDNSTVLLLEYSEEHPVMLSQAGMGNKVVNYYRRTHTDDNARPKSELGETHVLMPEDKSPFHNFGHVDPGETAMALYNSMYRAPIFKQTPKSSDFLVVRETTGLNGTTHYLRNIEHSYIVGQELPSTAVPGTHSRQVTTASKNRLKAISFRIARRKKSHRIRVEDVTRHFPDTNDMQNRQKMKEFMAFSKEHKEWEMRGGEALPDEDAIQKLIKPETICLLESMQVGAQYLQDSGFAEDDKDDDDDKEDENESIEQKLAPWKTTKNFQQATQGKAMLKLYGEGDPSGRGEAFSFIKTSMKGGFVAQGSSLQDTMNVQVRADGSHKYNVARQQKSYDDSVRQIWDRQKQVLTSEIEVEDIDDEGIDGQIEDANRNRSVRATPISGTPGPGRRRDDETATSFSKRSMTSQAQKFLRITRKVYNSKTYEYEDREHIETDPAVIKAYMRRKEAERINRDSMMDLSQVVPTGDEEVDARNRKLLEDRLAAMENKKVRRAGGGRKSKARLAAEAAAAAAGSPDAMDAGSPDAGDIGTPGADGETPSGKRGRQTQATQRKCANCGQVGHIKTNKKLCPMLNGTISQEQQGGEGGAFMGAPPTL